METERSHFPYRAIDRTKANLSVRHDDYVMFSFAGKHPLGLLPQSTTDGRLIPQYENNIEARTESLISVFEPETFCSTVKGHSQEKKKKNLSSNLISKIDKVWFTKEPYPTSLPRQPDFHLLASVLVF